MDLTSSKALGAAVLMGLALGACTTLGTGIGSTESGGEPVSFAWKSTDGGVTGTMSATVGAGSVFTGPYLELTQASITPQFFAPIWMGWNPYWNDWPYGLNGSTTTYTGKAVANLQGPDSQRMRCRFDLNDPVAGMGGGGQGKCQVAGGATIDATFPRA